MSLSEDQGGFGYESFNEFMQSLWLSDKDYPQFSANMTRWARDHGAEFASPMFERAPEAGDKFALERVLSMVQEEGKAIQEYLTRSTSTSIMTLLKTFSMDKLAIELQAIAPTLWEVLVQTVSTPGSEKRRKKSLVSVLTSICSMLSILRSQKANDYQVMIAMFLLGSGASKREIEVLAHAGLCLSYSTTITCLKKLSKEGTRTYKKVAKESACSIVWDNLNIAFRVDAQRLHSANHFDNGTTATLIPLYDPTSEDGSVPHGTIPLNMKPPRTTSDPIFEWPTEHVMPSPVDAEQLSRSCLWQIKRMAIEHIEGLKHLASELEPCPEVKPIPVHKTDQYPLPAMNEDESSIEGTIRVYIRILRNVGFTDDDLKAHGLLFSDGDLLSESLVSKIEAARRNSDGPIQGMKAPVRRFGIFHSKMAGGRLVVNEHWGKPNSPWAGSLWWENTKLLGRKTFAAGWKGKKATPWKPAHELIHISLPAHVKDGYRILCGKPDLEAWARTATLDDFNTVSQRVMDELFSTHAVEKLRNRPDEERDHTLENVILYNRDALFYIEFVTAIKRGDIGRVVNVLRIWMVMMRGVSTMPKYADAIFETLGRVDKFDPVLRELFLNNWLVNLTGRADGFKEIDLLQEHQNFWAKIIYMAKGSNKSWAWLSLITVCIFTLRDAMRTVQKAYKITPYGERHSTPSITDEVNLLADALAQERIQSYVPDRRGNKEIAPVRDLIIEGSKYPNSAKAFQHFRAPTWRAENLGVLDPEDVEAEEDSESEEESEEEDYTEVGPTDEDLAVDDEEPYGLADEMLEHAEAMVDL
ncbi:hypothetical protein PLICRDRAFT_156573 [Plicaturopsis crispa FD-325 SS-3]|nr:hypothetical protein PLICRDRAFT_156573 [Plicaturopsis crispa FD-325 SS-3]